MPRLGRLIAFGACIGVLAMPPGLLKGAVASTAALILEALPFVAIGAALERPLPTGKHATSGGIGWWLSALIGCGCGGGPAALSLPAAGLAWLSFGPAVALARIPVGLVLAAHGRCRAPHARVDPLDELAALVPYGFAGALAAELSHAAGARAFQLPAPALGLGLLLGALAPCALGAVGFAAAVRVVAPWCAAGVLLGNALRPDLGAPGSARAIVTAWRAAPPFAAVLLCAATALLLSRGGVVHPRMLVPVSLGCSIVALHSVLRRDATVALFAPVVVGVAATFVAPTPRWALDRTVLSGAFPGERMTFTGVVERTGGAETLVRFAITCCRADAAPVAVRLDHPSGLPTGTWAHVDGVLSESGGGLVLRVRSIAAVAPPPDPFLYR